MLAVRNGGAGTDQLIDHGAFAIDADAINFDALVQELMREEDSSAQLSLL